jgi:hypothetical protein
MPGCAEASENFRGVSADDSGEHSRIFGDLVDIDRVSAADIEGIPINNGFSSSLVNGHGFAIDIDGDSAFDDLCSSGEVSGEESSW